MDKQFQVMREERFYLGGKVGIIKDTRVKTAIHEGLHFLGFDERYDNSFGGFIFALPGYSRDIMNNDYYEGSGLDFTPAHFYDLAETSLTFYWSGGNNNTRLIGPPSPIMDDYVGSASRMSSVDCTVKGVCDIDNEEQVKQKNSKVQVIE